MDIVDCAGLFHQLWPILCCNSFLTRITGHLSRAEMYAKEVLSDVADCAGGCQMDLNSDIGAHSRVFVSYSMLIIGEVVKAMKF